MRRMQRDFFLHFHSASKSLVFAIFFIGFFLFAQPAYADPHAVFYTDRAQEQFFYNSLAALNQADFVEPGRSDGTGRTREELLAGRSAAVARTAPNTPQPGDKAFAGEQNPIITSTHTDLPAILSRSVTLEGNDLWTAYLVNQFALETTTRRSTSELARIFCDRGLGRVGCSDIPGIDQKQETAFNPNVNLNLSRPAVARGAALASGRTEEDALRQKITDPNKTENTLPADDPSNFPRPQSASVSSLQQANASDSTKSGLINGMLASIFALAPEQDINPFAHINFGSGGEIEIAEDISLGDYLTTVRKIANLPSSLHSTATKAEEDAIAFQHYIENPTARADFKLVKTASGGVRGEITVPASAKLAQVQAGADLIARASQDQKFANPETLADPGEDRVIPIVQITPVPTPVPTVNGISTDTPSNTTADSDPRVEGIATTLYNLYKAYYDNPPPTTNSPSDNLITPNRESGVYELLQAFTNDTYRKGTENPDTTCGFCLQVDSILKGVGNSIGQIYCALFPTTDLCKKGEDTL